MNKAADEHTYLTRRPAPATGTLVLSLLLVSLPLYAQTTQPPDEPPSEEQLPTGSTAEGAVADAPALPAENTAETATPASEDPFDYEASEQISEDLSVSFPVDI